MSGSSYSEDCPRCGGKETIMASNDYKPHQTASGECIQCGYCYYTKLTKLTDKELFELRKDFNWKGKNLTKKQKLRIQQYDKDIGVE